MKFPRHQAVLFLVALVATVFFQNCGSNPAKFLQPGSSAQHSPDENVTENGNGRGYDGMVYRHHLLAGICSDGLDYDSMIVVKKDDTAYLVRDNCVNLDVEIVVRVERVPASNQIVYNGVPFTVVEEVALSGSSVANCTGSLTRECAPQGIVLDLSGNAYNEYTLHLVRVENISLVPTLYLIDSPLIDCSRIVPYASWGISGGEDDCQYRKPAAGGEVIVIQKPEKINYAVFIERNAYPATNEGKAAVAISIGGRTVVAVPKGAPKMVEHLGTIMPDTMTFVPNGQVFDCSRQSTLCAGQYK